MRVRVKRITNKMIAAETIAAFNRIKAVLLAAGVSATKVPSPESFDINSAYSDLQSKYGHKNEFKPLSEDRIDKVFLLIEEMK